MEIRALREAEIEEAIEHVCLAFGKPGHVRFRYHVTHDSSFTLEQARVCVIDGRIVSYVRVSDRPIRIGSAVVRMGGIGAVSTNPEHCNRGYSTALLWDAVRYMERERYDLSMLFTGIPRHYAKVGWVTFPAHSFSAVPGDPPSLETSYVVRDFDEARDLEAVIEIYNRYNEERTGTMARPRQYWLDHHSRVMGVLPLWVAETDGRVVAFMSGTPIRMDALAYLPEHSAAVAPICARVMREGQEAVRSAASGEPETRHGRRSEPRITGELPKSHPALELLAHWSPRPMEHTESESMMLRVIRLVPLMQKVAPVLERRLSHAGLLPRRVTICIREQDAAARIVIDGNHLHVEAGDGGDIVLEPGTRNFLKLLLGDTPFSVLRELIPGAAGVSLDDAALLDILFLKQEPVYYGCDHF
jgi:predicted N-acetyltransferase YhbS